ncbi:PLP-dependent aminotransferase family protein [Motiliproteus sp. MSK22-1]|uniref:aminotransferase-like domain-containing protein n=1 Tax=Motiliproteus sp. MSK22-1 TaxID=1897630 RepID=UPI00097883E9|nr:PLP-dependent aminotransferase family protein [Motiliproteus sp. MSK22-1]OMH30262.1 GntR family transcriptional regulator [Motiliproteus sp. MSK22-1]
MFAQRINRLSGSLIREILSLADKGDVISFAGGLPSPEAMPDLNLANIPQSMRQYGATEGERSLRESIAQELCNRGRECCPEQVLITSGSQQGIDLIAKLFVDEGAPVLMESPSYLAAIQAFKLFGADIKPISLQTGGLDLEVLNKLKQPEQLRFAYLIPTFQNPSGCCYDMPTREAVAEWLTTHKIPLIEDEPYRELVYSASERTPICSLIADSPWVSLGTFSKTGIPGFRVGYLTCSEDLHPYFVKLKQATDLHSNRIGQHWAWDYINGPLYPQQLQKIRELYRSRRDTMASALAMHFSDLAKWQTPAGGLFFWLQLNSPQDTRELLPVALQQGVAFMPGEAFYSDSEPPKGAMRLNFSHASAEQIDQGLERLADVIRRGLN